MRKKHKVDEDFVQEEAGKVTEHDIDDALNKKSRIEEKILSSGTMRKYAEVIKQMFLMLNDYRKGAYRDVPWLTISTLVFILIYVLNPLDLIPDFIPIIGYLDDATVLVLGLNWIQTDLHKYLKWKEKQEAEESLK